MTSSLIYNDGTVSVTFNSAVVTGSLTGWAVSLVTGGMFSCAGLSIPILSVEDDTHLTLAYPWPVGAVAGAAYAIARDTSEAVRAAWTNDRLATIIQRLSLVGIHPDGSGTIAERNALDPVPSTGYIWLYAEAGHDLAIYRKSASGWDGPFQIRGAAGAPASPTSLASLSDVTLTSPTTGKVLRYNGTAWVDAALTADIVDDTGSVHKFVSASQLTKIDGAVVGPASAVDGHFALFNGLSGKAAADSGVGLSVLRTVEISISENVGVFPGTYPDNIIDFGVTLSAGRIELRDGSADAEADVWLLKNGAYAAGPWSVTLNAPAIVTGLSVAAAAGDNASLAVSYVSGTVYDLSTKFWGA